MHTKEYDYYCSRFILSNKTIQEELLPLPQRRRPADPYYEGVSPPQHQRARGPPPAHYQQHPVSTQRSGSKINYCRLPSFGVFLFLRHRTDVNSFSRLREKGEAPLPAQSCAFYGFSLLCSCGVPRPESSAMVSVVFLGCRYRKNRCEKNTSRLPAVQAGAAELLPAHSSIAGLPSASLLLFWRPEALPQEFLVPRKRHLDLFHARPLPSPPLSHQAGTEPMPLACSRPHPSPPRPPPCASVVASWYVYSVVFSGETAGQTPLRRCLRGRAGAGACATGGMSTVTYPQDDAFVVASRHKPHTRNTPTVHTRLLLQRLFQVPWVCCACVFRRWVARRT